VAQHGLELQIHSQGDITLLVNDVPMKLEDQEGMHVGQLTLRPGKTKILLMVKFSAQDPTRTCLIEAFIPK
jgi:hypothetical protein